MAIAFDTSTSGFGDTSPVTVSHTCTGSNLLLVVAITIYDVTDKVTGVTYNSVAMTRLNVIGPSVTSSLRSYLYYLLGPSTGANNVVVSLSSAENCYVAIGSYTGVKQTGFPDATNTGSATFSSAELTVAVTTVLDNCWLVGSWYSGGSGCTAGAGTIVRRNGDCSLLDSNGATTPAGSDSLKGTYGAGSSDVGMIVASFAPAADATGHQKNMLTLGVG
jgi:hypothetical protein